MPGWEETLPEWNEEGTEPTQAKKDEGWQAGEKPPAGWFNWLLHKTYKSLQEIRTKIDEGVDAVKLQGRNVQDTAPSDGDVLEWDNENNKWKPKDTVMTHKSDNAPHQYGSRFEWRYNSSDDSLELVVIE